MLQGQRAAFGLQLDREPRIVDGCFDLAAVARDAGVCSSRVTCVPPKRATRGHVEAGERTPEVLTLGRDGAQLCPDCFVRMAAARDNPPHASPRRCLLMPLTRVAAPEAIAALAEFDAVIDARSESEFAEDHVPGAANWPVLNDAERHAIGTEFKQVSPFDARKRGAAMAARNIAQLIDRHAPALQRGWRPLLYCWRGGQRSGSLALVLGEIGFRVSLLDGGYRAFRRVVIDTLEVLPAAFDFRLLCGRTGSAKSRLLQALQAAGAQVLDLEALAAHRGSVLGPLPGQPQPSQKAFETALWHVLRRLDSARPVFVEGESRTIGRLRVPEALLLRLRAAPCLQVQMPLAARVAFLLDDYAHFVHAPESLCQRLAALREVRGADLVERWQQQARAGELPAVVQALLQEHYDPIYERSMARNFAGFASAPPVELADGAQQTLEDAARRLLAQT